ncbi:MAG: septum site-determining protein MinC [Anaerolineae bacterium]
MTADNVSIKGTSDGLTITIGSGNWQGILKKLDQKLGERAAFFKGGRVVLVVGERLLDNAQIEAVGRLLAGQQMTLWAINGQAEETQTTAKSLGLEVQRPSSSSPTAPNAASPDPLTSLTVRRTLRSGQSVEYPGNVVIIGDVNPGARVRAGGHIIVWGKLRGTAHAGAIAPQEAFVCALDLAPMQLIIGHIISRSPSEERPTQVIPEMAYVQEGQIIAEAWQ